MRHSFIFTHEVEDIYTPEDLIEVMVEVEYQIAGADPDTGIMSSYPEGICVVSTDCALFDVDTAQRFIDGGSKEANRIIESIDCDDDGPDPDFEYERWRDDRMRY